jgi:hypothetical protein
MELPALTTKPNSLKSMVARGAALEPIMGTELTADIRALDPVL